MLKPGIKNNLLDKNYVFEIFQPVTKRFNTNYQ